MKPKDPIVADLLYSYALFKSKNEFLEFSLDLLNFSIDYGYQNPQELKSLTHQFNDTILKATEEAEFELTLKFLLGLIILLFFTVLYKVYSKH